MNYFDKRIFSKMKGTKSDEELKKRGPMRMNFLKQKGDFFNNKEKRPSSQEIDTSSDGSSSSSSSSEENKDFKKRYDEWYEWKRNEMKKKKRNSAIAHSLRYVNGRRLPSKKDNVSPDLKKLLILG